MDEKKAISPKDRFLISINHKEPDRVPTFTNLTPEIAIKLAKKMNLPYEIVDSRLTERVSNAEILTNLGNDAVGIRPTRKKDVLTDMGNNIYKDKDLGFIWKEVGYYFEIIDRPLKDAENIRDIEIFKMPDPLVDEDWSFAANQIKKYGEKYAIIGVLETTIFELSWNLVGMEKFLMDLFSQKPYIIALIDKVLEYNYKSGARMVELGVDVVITGDDFGTQNAMLISPELWRKIFKPRMKWLFNRFKKINPDIKIAYHSCGHIIPIIPDLIEIGLDILNPIQPRAKGMDLEKIKEDFGDDLVLFGGVDEQYTLPFGTVKDVEDEVKKRMCQAASGGGFIIAPAHNIQPDTPLENILAYFNAVKKYGIYN
jgi:uroporphyrinogen decarboxylase